MPAAAPVAPAVAMTAPPSFQFIPDLASPRANLVASSGPLVPSALPHKIPTLDNYTRQVSWSNDPAASYLASMHNDRSVRFWPSASFLSSSSSPESHSCYSMAESIADIAWSPSTSDHPPMMAISCPDQPIHLVSPPPPPPHLSPSSLADDVEANTPPRRLATYAAYTHLDQLIGPTSLSFHPWLPTRLVAGYPNGTLNAFDLTRPSLPATPAPQSPHKLKKGIVSNLTHLPHFAALALASYSTPTLALADANSLHIQHVIRDLPPATCVATDTLTSTYLVSSHRSGLVACHDVRDVRGPVWTFQRPCPSNMRTIVQVLESWAGQEGHGGGGGWVAVAGCGPGASEVHVVDLATGTQHVRVLSSSPSSQHTRGEQGEREVLAACHVVGGGRWWATGQGSRRYVVQALEDEDEGEDEERAHGRDNAVKVWEMDGKYVEWTM